MNLMTKLEKLIEELCPNGVEYVKLGTFATISRGGSFQKKDFCENGVPCIHYGQIYTKYGLFADKTITFISEETAKKQKFAEPNDIVMAVTSENVEDVCKCLAWIGDEKIAVSGHSAIIHHNQNAKYLCYYFHTSAFFQQKRKLAHGTKVIEVKPDSLKDVLIPLPPLEVQAEIVKILDDYSTSVAALQQEIEKELTARKKQYKYYLNSFFDEIKADKVALSSLGSLKRGKRFVHADDTDSGVPCIHYGELYTYYGVYADTVKTHIREELRDKMRYATTGDVVIVGAGENNIDIGVGVAWLGNHDIAIHDACYTLHHKQNPKYVSYFLRTDMYHNQIKKYVYEGKICSISAENVGKALIPLPPLHEQERIVQILDRFDKLCNDISEGLPAEIEARRKQYEYYRDKLLTFKEAK